MIGNAFFFFFFNDTATTEIYTLSLHDALPIYTIHAGAGGLGRTRTGVAGALGVPESAVRVVARDVGDRKSTRLNSSHGYISYAVFCLKKKKTQQSMTQAAVYTPVAYL